MHRDEDVARELHAHINGSSRRQKQAWGSEKLAGHAAQASNGVSRPVSVPDSPSPAVAAAPVAAEKVVKVPLEH